MQGLQQLAMEILTACAVLSICLGNSFAETVDAKIVEDISDEIKHMELLPLHILLGSRIRHSKPKSVIDQTDRHDTQVGDISRQLRLLTIKKQIVDGLGVNPNQQTRHKVQHHRGAIQRAVQEFNSDERRKEHQHRSNRQERSYSDIKEIISFSENALEDGDNVLRFKAAGHLPSDELRVTRALLWVLINYRQPAQQQKNPDLEKTISIFVYTVNQGDIGDHLISLGTVTLQKTKWHSIRIPPNIIQSMFDRANRTLLLRVRCAGCPQGVEVALASNISQSPSQEDAQPYLVIHTQRKVHRPERQSLSCSIRGNRCCKQPLYISFKEIGFDNWIIAPEGFNANFCAGKCDFLDFVFSSHSVLLDRYRRQWRKRDIPSCCSPKKMSPISLLYLADDSSIIKKDIPDMILDECGCS